AVRDGPLRPEDRARLLPLRGRLARAESRSRGREAHRGQGAREGHQSSRDLGRGDHRAHALSDDQRGRENPRREDRHPRLRHRYRLDQRLRLPDRQGRADVLGRARRDQEDRRPARILARPHRQGRVQAGAAAEATRRDRRQLLGKTRLKMDLANAPWKAAYPAGLSPDVTLAAFPVHEIVDRSAARWGDKTAFCFRAVAISHADLKMEVERCAAAFVRAGVGRGDRVALLLPNTIYHPITFFGAVKAGATVVHLSPLDSRRILEHKLTDSGARVLVTTNIGECATRAAELLRDGLVDRLIVGDDAAFGPSSLTGARPEGENIIDFDAFMAGAGPADLPAVTADDLALLQYTGGTTGLPKGAMLTHRNLSAAVSSYDLWFDALGLMRPGGDRVLLFLPLFHIYALSAVMLRALNNGLELILHTRFDAETALAEIEAGANSFPGVPTMWIAIAATPGFEKRNLSSLRYCASGGAPLPVEIARKLKRATGHDILGGWGMTETSPAGTNIPPTHPDRVGTIGVPLPGIYVDVVALDEPSRVLEQGETG